ncbi:hypothetical protein B0H13DRAFT_2040010 [Mycena leptocephala]|nr:hypothetical protein B0H13DRAFT_2040010 [Mycena leptocephala]
MDRLGIPSVPSATTIERWQDAHFVILFQFLEHYRTLTIRDHLSPKQMAGTFKFLARIVSWENPLPLNAETFQDPSTRATIRTALTKYKVTVSGEDGDSLHLRSIIETRLIGLNSPAADTNSDSPTVDNALAPLPAGQPSTSRNIYHNSTPSGSQSSAS